MSMFKGAKDMVTRSGNQAKDLVARSRSQVHWVKLLIAFVGLLAISFAFAAALQFLRVKLNLNLYQFELVAYTSVFVSSLLANMTIIAPVPFALAIMLTAARDFNPVIVALMGALGGSLGEMSGYVAGRLGRKIAIPDSVVGYQRVEQWVRRFGFWAIFVLAFQPIVPFDIGGLVAGAARMPVQVFLPALFAGKFPKYVLLVYAGLGIISFLPSWAANFFGGN
jgi:membrane protein YqaA with SNARE-associated domain